MLIDYHNTVPATSNQHIYTRQRVYTSTQSDFGRVSSHIDYQVQVQWKTKYEIQIEAEVHTHNININSGPIY